MTKDRKEPTLSPIKPDQDDIAHHRQRTAAKTRPATGGGSANTGGHRPVVVRSKLAPFAFLLAVTGLGLAGYAYWQLLEAQKATEAAVTRIGELEQRLEMTGEESETSMAAVQAKLKWADSEIRKLWGVAYDTNRKAIAANKDSIGAVRQSVGNVETQLSNSVAGVRKSLSSVEEQVAGQENTIEAVRQANLRVQKQAQEVADTLRDLREAQTALQSRVGDNEQAIEAIDAFRRSINQDLLQLKSQVRAANSPSQ